MPEQLIELHSQGGLGSKLRNVRNDADILQMLDWIKGKRRGLLVEEDM